jgi:hypothetical protein
MILFRLGKTLSWRGENAVAECDAWEADLAHNCIRLSETKLRITHTVQYQRAPAAPAVIPEFPLAIEDVALNGRTDAKPPGRTLGDIAPP